MRPSALKMLPAYSIASVDHALKLAAVLQLEGGLTVAEAAERLGVARSTAHRILQMLVYRDFAIQDEDRIYRPGLALELADHSTSRAAELRKKSLPYLQHLSATFEESANVSVRAGSTTRFIASVECQRVPRVTSREGMVFPLHRTTTGMLYLASLPDPEVRQYFDPHPDGQSVQERGELYGVDQVRRVGFALNINRSENGVVAIGVPVPLIGSKLFAGLALCLPSVRYDERQIDKYVSVLRSASAALARDLAGASDVRSA